MKIIIIIAGVIIGGIIAAIFKFFKKKNKVDIKDIKEVVKENEKVKEEALEVAEKADEVIKKYEDKDNSEEKDAIKKSKELNDRFDI